MRNKLRTMTRMPIITDIFRTLDWEWGLRIHAKPTASDAQATNHGSPRAEPNPALGSFGQPEKATGWLRCADPQGARSFPAPFVWVRRRTDLGVLASLPSSDHLGSGGQPAHPGLPQVERVWLAGMIAAPPFRVPPIPEAVGRAIAAPALHGSAAGRQGGRAAGQQQRVVSVVQLGQGVLHTALHGLLCTTSSPSPIRTGQFHLYCSPPRGLLVAPVPTGARMGQVSSARNLRAARKEGNQSRATIVVYCLLRPAGVGRAGWQAVCRVDAMMHAMRIQGIEAIFRPACGRAYSRTWTQRILGRYADD